MTLIGICPRCVEERPSAARVATQELYHGPNGDRLCSRHKREAWEEEYL